MRVALDTSAIIYLSDFRKFKEIFTVQEVVEELKDKISSIKLSTLNIKVVEPSSQSVKKVEKVAYETGDLEKLSKTDLKLLALAKEKKLIIISDDRNIQNVAEKMGIKYFSVFSKEITQLIKWGKFCKSCKKFYKEGEYCSICGSKLIRKPIKKINLFKKRKL
jgi:UPF0271 protein